MTSLLFENPLVVGLIGMIVFGMSLYGWLQTGNPWAGRSAILVTVLTAVALWLNVWVETDRESVHAMLMKTVVEIENNQIEKWSGRIHSEATERVHQAMANARSFRFKQAKISKVHAIELSEIGLRNIAFVRINVVAEAESIEKTTAGMHGKHAAWLQLELEQVGENWLVVDCEIKGPQHEFLRHADY